jgi:hypothetical protein
MSCWTCTAAHRLPPSGCTSRLRSRCLGNHPARVLVTPPNDLITPGDGVRADERIRTADPFITRTPRRLRLVAVCRADCLGQANLGVSLLGVLRLLQGGVLPTCCHFAVAVDAARAAGRRWSARHRLVWRIRPSAGRNRPGPVSGAAPSRPRRPCVGESAAVSCLVRSKSVNDVLRRGRIFANTAAIAQEPDGESTVRSACEVRWSGDRA